MSSWLREAKRWWSIKLTSQLFLLLHSLFIVETVENRALPNAPLKNRKNVLALIEILLANFCSSRRKSSNALSIIASMSKWFDNRWFLSHFSSTSQALECQQKRCHNRPMRGYTWIQYTWNHRPFENVYRRSLALAQFPLAFFSLFPVHKMIQLVPHMRSTWLTLDRQSANIRESFWHSRKFFQKGLTHDFGQKLKISLKSDFLWKRPRYVFLWCCF